LSAISASNSRLSDERDLHLAGAFDDVVVGDHEPGGIDDDAGAERAQHLLARHRAKELAEQRIVHERVAVFDDPGGVDVDHRRRHALDDRREGKLQLGGRGRTTAVLRGRPQATSDG
jgi:hypothetical protein